VKYILGIHEDSFRCSLYVYVHLHIMNIFTFFTIKLLIVTVVYNTKGSYMCKTKDTGIIF